MQPTFHPWQPKILVELQALGFHGNNRFQYRVVTVIQRYSNLTEKLFATEIFSLAEQN